jgi:molecular chaperone GrpE (heat shock protein)
MRSVVASIKEMADLMAEVEDLRARMAREAAECKLLARQCEQQLEKERSMNTGKTFDEVNHYYRTLHSML